MIILGREMLGTDSTTIIKRRAPAYVVVVVGGGSSDVRRSTAWIARATIGRLLDLTAEELTAAC